MKALVAKEIRLMLPVFAVALLLAAVPSWLAPNHLASTFSLYSLYPFGFGAVLLALAPFGREFSMNTFPVLLAQPLERATVWRTKVAVLAIALATVFGVWCLSGLTPVRFVLHGGVDPGTGVYVSGFYTNLPREQYVSPDIFATGGIVMLAVFSGGLWTTLLLRQVTGPFWFSILLPATIAMVVNLFGGNKVMVFSALGLYSLAGFFLARRLFYRAEEIAWTGGVLTLPGWKSTKAAAGSKIRSYRPGAAMIRKEFQIHQIGLAGIGGLFSVHFATLAFHHGGPDSKLADTARLISDLCCMLWVIAPLFVGATAVAEERKLGTMEAQLCLPVSSRWQFAVKLSFVILLGSVLSAALFWFKVRIGHSMNGFADFGETKIGPDLDSFIMLAALFCAIALIAFFASSLTRNIMQALVVGGVTAVIFWGLVLIAVPYWGYSRLGTFWAQLLPWNGYLVYFVGAPVLVTALIWLSYRNYRRLSETWRLWRRNLLGLLGAVLFVCTATAAIYHRAWEYLTPLEPRHGSVRISPGEPPRLRIMGGLPMVSLAVVLPDGRLWESPLVYGGNWHFKFFDMYYSLGLGGKWNSLQGNHFVDGSNWVDAVAGFRDTTALRGDGTLWVSEKPRERVARPGASHDEQPETLVRVGDEADWQSMTPITRENELLLLKTDGTLWRWDGTGYDGKKPWPGMRAFTPHRLGTETDWADIISASVSPGQSYWRDETWAYAWKKTGQAWTLTGPVLGWPTNNELAPDRGLERQEGLDQTRWRSITRWNDQWSPYQVGVREDGSLWVWYGMLNSSSNYARPFKGQIGQMGTETNWVQVANANRTKVGLKADGTLWRWDPESPYVPRPPAWPGAKLPVRMGMHDDWVAVCGTLTGFITLAADGSLWFWYDQSFDYAWGGGMPLLAVSRKPVKLGNIFGQE